MRLPLETAADYISATKILQGRFEPSCKKELQTAKRKKDEGWADLADRLRLLAQKGYPDLEDKAKERLALNKRPTTFDEAVSAMLEIKCYAETKLVGGVDLHANGSKDQLVAGVGTKLHDGRNQTVGRKDGSDWRPASVMNSHKGEVQAAGDQKIKAPIRITPLSAGTAEAQVTSPVFALHH
ncbi:hypothetical protein EMCRGX_G028204 [Ephydatia muelleri]